MASKAIHGPGTVNGAEVTRRTKLSQDDVPAFSLNEALRVAEVLRDQFAKAPTKPIDVAQALAMQPNSGHFRMLTRAAVAYGLTDGTAFADRIQLTALGRRVVAPTEEGDDIAARREALLRPRVIGEFLQKYDGSPLPSPPIARNVLDQMGVPSKALDRTFELIVSEASTLGLIVEIKDKRYVRLDAAVTRPTVDIVDESDPILLLEDGGRYEERSPELKSTPTQVEPTFQITNNRVFVTHGSNKAIVEQIKEILVFGKYEPVVSVEREATAKPVPDKVMDDMRGCYAGIVHVGTEKVLLDSGGDEHRVLNENVLIEIGAAMALFGRRFVLLVEQGVALPSNLHGLYQVRYQGNRLDYEATMKLLKAFNEFQSKEDEEA